ncbi:MAG TPA: hypothetical protein VFU07_10320 [Candidatus Lumbricidophila sp.]|nr:hypothetical protein [Candidatus Lumbricidophila sp.]
MSRTEREMPHHSAIQELLVEQMRADLLRRAWWQTLPGRIGIVGAALAISGAAVAAVVMRESRPVSDTAVVHCLDVAARAVDGSLPGSAVSIAAPDGVVPIDDAAAVCEQVWRSGSANETDPLNPFPTPGIAPEDVTVCVTDTGEAAVVPSRIECSVLQLHPYQPKVPTGR